jgi:hypothetical protein
VKMGTVIADYALEFVYESKVRNKCCSGAEF